MLIRHLGLAALVFVAAGLAVLSAVLVPVTVIVALMVGLLGGLLGYAAMAGPAGPRRPGRGPRACHTALAVGSGTAVGLVLTGLAALLGSATVPLLLAAAVLLAPWAGVRWRRHHQHRYRSLHSSTRLDTATPKSRACRTAGGSRGRPGEVQALSTMELCALWQHSYHALREAPDHGTRRDLVELRGGCLDELEHRDPTAVARWLASESRPAARGPRRHLTARTDRPGPVTSAESTAPLPPSIPDEP